MLRQRIRFALVPKSADGKPEQNPLYADRRNRFSLADFLIRYTIAKKIFPRKLCGFDGRNRRIIILVRTSNNL